MIKQHPRKFTILLVVMTLILGVFQSGLAFGLDFEAPTLTCDSAAVTYLGEGLTARPTQQVESDDFEGSGESVLAVFMNTLIEDQLLTNTHSVFADPALAPVLEYNIAFGTEVEVLGDMRCISFDDGNMIARYWEVETPNTTGYMIESVTWLTASIDIESDGDTIESSTENFTLRLLTPVFKPGVDGIVADEINISDDLMGTYYCGNSTPKSYLAVGMDAEIVFDGWMQYAQYNENLVLTGYGDPIPLDEYGIGVMQEMTFSGILQEPWVIDTLKPPVIVENTDLYESTNFEAPIVKIIDGPECVMHNVYPAGNDKYNGPERFMTYWKIAFDMNGQTYQGWYLENMGQDSWWGSNDADFFWNHYLTTYHMQPLSDAGQANGNANCPASSMYAGVKVQPTSGAMNLRTAPDGDVMGRLGAEETIILLGGPTCEGGSNWWSTERGFIAENDPTSGMRLITPAIEEEEIREEVPTGETTVTPVPSQPEPEETRVPDTDDDDDDKKDNNRDESGREESSRGEATEDSCDPTTGRGC